MPEILRFRAGWGVDPGNNWENYVTWLPELKAQGYSGIEFNPNSPDGFHPDLHVLRKLADDNGLEIIAQLASIWPRVERPRPLNLGPKEHLESYRQQLLKAKELRPIKVNVQSGADYWTIDQSVEFYKGTLALEAELGLAGKVCHETHRNRSLFLPYTAAAIVQRVPELRVTGDFSHHVVCCERLLDVGEEDKELISQIIPNVNHIHARIGTTQGSQCPDPSDPTFEAEKRFFDNLWIRIVKDFEKNYPGEPITFVPEYGPYPYHAYNAKRPFYEVANAEGIRLEKLFKEALQN